MRDALKQDEEFMAAAAVAVYAGEKHRENLRFAAMEQMGCYRTNSFKFKVYDNP